mmetsp:Transcript_122192/g.222278  ORF Transcript_122192/g.222278 Transcript_122192/m.222278 type:complete len:284 (+) Transcript_122192:139-990(+)
MDWADLRIAALFSIFIIHFALRWLNDSGPLTKKDVPLFGFTANSESAESDKCTSTASSGRVEQVPSQPSFTQQVARLPGEIRGKVARPLKLCDLAALCTTCRSFHAQLWDLVDVWCATASDCALSIDRGSCGEEVREAFRHQSCHLDGTHLRSLPPHRYVAILQEAALMVRGLLPRDGKQCVEELCTIVERALHAHDPAQEAAVNAAERFIDAMHNAMAVFTEPQIERIEYAYHSAGQLHTLMVSSMQQRSEASVWDSFFDDIPSPLDERMTLHADDAQSFCP